MYLWVLDDPAPAVQPKKKRKTGDDLFSKAIGTSLLVKFRWKPDILHVLIS